jgi:hypothetical protein
LSGRIYVLLFALGDRAFTRYGLLMHQQRVVI